MADIVWGHSDDVTFTKTSLLNFIKLVQAHGDLSKLQFYSMQDIKAGRVTATYTIPGDNTVRAEFDATTVNAHIADIAIVRLDVPFGTEGRHQFISVGSNVTITSGTKAGAILTTINDQTTSVYPLGFSSASDQVLYVDNHFFPKADLTYNLGRTTSSNATQTYAALRWNSIYANNLHLSNSCTIVGNLRVNGDSTFIGKVNIGGDTTIGSSNSPVNLTINGKTISIPSLPSAAGNTSQFWRGDGTWSNVLEGDFTANKGNIWAGVAGTGSNYEYQLGVRSKAGRLYLYSSSKTNERGIYTHQYDNSNSPINGTAVLAINSNNKISFYGTADRAKADESGNNIKSSYGATITYTNNALILKSKSGTTLSSAIITIPANTDTKNTAGAYPWNDKKLFLIGATAKTTATANHAVTYVNEHLYVTESNNLAAYGTVVETYMYLHPYPQRGTTGSARLWYNGENSTNANYLPHSLIAGGVGYSTGQGVNKAVNFYASKVFNAVFNDYAEYRKTINLKPGRVVIDNDDGSLSCSSQRLQPGAQVISDTFGHSMGMTEDAKTPLAVAGRVLVYPYQFRENYHAGMAVCSAPNGTADIMTREEIKEYPDCIIGIVSEIPNYETWGTDNIKVDGRIWVKVK